LDDSDILHFESQTNSSLLGDSDTVGKQNSVWNFMYRERPTS
jgi:hypothetical protein